MKKIVYIPLDSRPCNTSWIEKFSKRAKLNLLMYPKALSGNLHQKGDQLSIIEFIKKHAIDADYLLISLDMLCSGGLVASRLGDIDVDHSKEMMLIFKDLKEVNKKLKIYAFDTIMRTAVTTYGYQTAQLHAQINRYSKLKGSLHIRKDEHEALELANLIKTIDPTDLKRYETARLKKHKMNLFYIDYVNQNIFDYLTILQEDSVENGLQIIEQNVLVKKIETLKIENKVKIFNGTDEGASTLLAKIIVEVFNLKPKISIEAYDMSVLKDVFLFEDRPFIQNLKQFFSVIGISESTLSKSDFVLAIFADDSKRLLHLNETTPIVIDESPLFLSFFKTVNQHIRSGRNVAFLDLSFPNGGFYDLLKHFDYLDLKAYSAWNTASNSTGSLLCDIMCTISGKESKSFLKERIMDDCIYQYIVRRILNERLLKEGVNMFNLEQHGTEVLNEIKTRLESYKDVIQADFVVSLPWNRTFEIDIDVSDSNDL